jgi:O-antigen ligase
MYELVYDTSLEDKINRNAKYMADQDSLNRSVKYWEQRIKSEKNEKGDSIWVNHIINSKNENKTSIGKRVLLWKIYIKKIRENIILGKGLGSIDWLQKESTNILDKPHNNYLFILTEFGIIGLLLFLNIFISMIKEFFITTQRNILKIIFPIIFLLSMCINDYFFIYNTLAFFGLFSYLLYSNKE